MIHRRDIIDKYNTLTRMTMDADRLVVVSHYHPGGGAQTYYVGYKEWFKKIPENLKLTYPVPAQIQIIQVKPT
jgi:hypothetical protein